MHHFDVRRSRFAHQLEHGETTADDLKARRHRWRMILARLALMASGAKTTPHGSNPIDEHMCATRRRFTPSAARPIPTRDHFAQRNRQRQVIPYDMNVIEQEHSPTSMQPLAIAHELFLFRPQPTHHATSRADRHAPCVCNHFARTRSRTPRPRRGVTPLARSYRDEAAVLRWQRSRRRGSRPREWHVLRGRHTRPPSRHARCMLGPR